MYKPGERPADKAGQGLAQESASTNSEITASQEGSAPVATATVAHKSENMEGEDVSENNDSDKK